MMRRLFIGALALSSVVFGQPDLNSVTVTATRTIYAQPDQVVFAVNVMSETSLEAVVAALAGSGITASNLVSVGGFPVTVNGAVFLPLQWTFTLPAPLSKLKDTIASLSALQQTIAQKNAGYSALVVNTPLFATAPGLPLNCSLVVQFRMQR
jgi:hypothetical protein